MIQISDIIAREILDSRGRPTVEVDMKDENGLWHRGVAPSGASTGAFEALEIRDKNPERYLGLGVLKAIENINKLADKIKATKFSTQMDFDNWLINEDGTHNKSYLGANTTLPLSLAFARLLSSSKGLSLNSFLGPQSYTLPVPLMNILNGGAHANNVLDVQEFMIAPVKGESFSEALRVGVEVFHHLKKILNSKSYSTAVGDEGGFAPNLKSNQEALQLILKAIETAGYKPGEDVLIALDVAATEMYDKKENKYIWEGGLITSEELTTIYKSWCDSFPIISIEDGYDEEDWSAWAHAHSVMGDKVQLVGDDLFVTNVKRLQKGIDHKSANSILIKVNQIGTLTETMDAIALAHQNNFTTVMSHRSGETEDCIISDLAVGLNCTQIKTGSPCRGERTAKYNQLLRIESLLGNNAKFAGKAAFLQQLG